MASQIKKLGGAFIQAGASIQRNMVYSVVFPQNSLSQGGGLSEAVSHEGI